MRLIFFQLQTSSDQKTDFKKHQHPFINVHAFLKNHFYDLKKQEGEMLFA